MDIPVMLVRAQVRQPKSTYDERLDGTDVTEDSEDFLVEQHFVVAASDKQSAKTAVEERCEARGWTVESYLRFEQRVSA